MGAPQFSSQVDNNFIPNSLDTSITANEANQLDVDILNQDVSTGYEVGETNISGANEIAVLASSGDGNSFSVTVEWTDGTGTVLYSESPSSLQSTTDGGANLIVKSTHVNVVFSGSSTDVDGTVNAH